jgi:hypothetical protein
MPIAKTVQADNGIMINYHRAIRLEVDLVANAANVLVNSHATEDAALAGLPIAWQSRVNVPVDQLAGNGPTLLGEIEDALISLAGSPFAGGTRTADRSDTVESARDRAWAAIKAARARAEAGNFTYDGGVYQINVGQVNGCVTAAILAKQGGAPYSQDWTLTDNTVRTLDADQVIGMGLAMLSTIDSIYKTGRDLRAQIDAAATIDAVEAIAWPA